MCFISNGAYNRLINHRWQIQVKNDIHRVMKILLSLSLLYQNSINKPKVIGLLMRNIL